MAPACSPGTNFLLNRKWSFAGPNATRKRKSASSVKSEKIQGYTDTASRYLITWKISGRWNSSRLRRRNRNSATSRWFAMSVKRSSASTTAASKPTLLPPTTAFCVIASAAATPPSGKLPSLGRSPPFQRRLARLPSLPLSLQYLSRWRRLNAYPRRQHLLRDLTQRIRILFQALLRPGLVVRPLIRRQHHLTSSLACPRRRRALLLPLRSGLPGLTHRLLVLPSLQQPLSSPCPRVQESLRRN